MRTAEQVLAVAVLVLVTGCVLPLVRPAAPRLLGLAWAVATLLVLAVWFLHEAPYEGPAIIVLTPTKGLTVVDMVVPPGAALAAAVAWRWWRGRPYAR